MAKLNSWIKKHLIHKSGSRKQSRDHPPFLTSPRRSITPTSLDTPGCLFFQLPGDVRSIILIMAFGARTLHMDVERQDEGWKWIGAICSRNRPGTPYLRYNWIGPWYDGCRNYIHDSKRRFKEGYNIGIMGFLLSCKQAYTEGMHILYSENCINIKDEPLLLHLPRLISPNRLASISALEIMIDGHRSQKDQERRSITWDHLKPILDNILTHCHNLRDFCISFKYTGYNYSLLDSPALPWIDAFYHATKMRKMRIGLPMNIYEARMIHWPNCSYQPTEKHPREGTSKVASHKSQWRCLDGEKPTLQWRSTERYPYPPLKLPIPEDGDDNVESSGYWLAEGDAMPVIQCGCPG